LVAPHRPSLKPQAAACPPGAGDATAAQVTTLKDATTMKPLRKRSPKPTAPARALRRLLEVLEDRTVPTAVAAPNGLVSWWTADNTAADLVGMNVGTLYNGVTFAP